MALTRGYVYIIGNHEFGWYKIGYTRLDPKARLAALQPYCPCPLKVVAHMEVRHARAVEYTLHDRFKTRRLHGEWFQLTKKEIASIQIDEEAAIAFHKAHVTNEPGHGNLPRGVTAAIPTEEFRFKDRVINPDQMVEVVSLAVGADDELLRDMR